MLDTAALTGKQLAEVASLRNELRQLREARLDRDTLLTVQLDVPDRVHRALGAEIDHYMVRARNAIDAVDTAMRTNYYAR